jgi:hypothetical protein
MLKTISKSIFDAVAGLTIIVATFYLAAITHIMPLPESVSSRVDQLALAFMDVLVACVASLISLFSALFPFF